MKSKTTIIHFVFILAILCSCQSRETKKETVTQNKIISIGGAVTETLYALDLGNNIQAVDVTSTFPETVHALPKLGHVSNISFEALLNYEPDVVVATQDPAGTALYKQIEGTQLQLDLIDAPTSIEGTQNMITSIGKIFNKEEDAVIINNSIDEDLNLLDQYLETIEQKPKVLFLYARGSDMLMVAGKETSADYMINLAGGINAVNEFNDFKPLSPEAAITANPDVILVFDSGLQSLNGLDGVLALPGISETKAAKEKKVVAMEGHYLLGFGPRIGKAALDLAKSIHQ